MPVCATPGCYNHVVRHGQVCPNCRPKKSSSSSKLLDNQRRERLYSLMTSECLRAAQKAERALQHPMFGCGYVGVYLPRQYKYTRWLVSKGYATEYENHVALNLPSNQCVHTLTVWANAFVAKMRDYDESYADRIRMESRLT